MNKVLSINLGGLPFTIDDDAYRQLENYLQSLHNHFRTSEGYDEIMNDIEARVGELMREGMGKRGIATTQDVKNAISVMGNPEDFGAESVETGNKTTQNASNTEGAKSSSTTAEGAATRKGRQLFRDMDNKTIAGVCSGLAAYFGVKDVVWLRILFGLLFIFSGAGVVLYILLWIIMPEAKTTADKLAMRGEPIDVNSIAKSVETTFESFSEKVNEFGKPENQARFQSQMSHVATSFGNAISHIFHGFGKVGRGVAIVVSVLLVIALLASWVSAAVGLTMAAPLVSYITDDSWRVWLVALSGFGIIAVPTLATILFMRRLVFHRSIADGWHIGMWSFFAVCVFLLASLAGNFVKNFNHTSETSQRFDMPDVEVLTIGSALSQFSDVHIQFGDLKVSDEYLVDRDVNMHVEKSDDGKFELLKKVTSEGATPDEARNWATKVEYLPSVSGDKLTVPRDFLIPKGAKWRGQSVNLTLKVPVGKTIKIDNRTLEVINYNLDIDEDKDEGDCNNEPIQIWEMTPKGLVCKK